MGTLPDVIKNFTEFLETSLNRKVLVYSNKIYSLVVKTPVLNVVLAEYFNPAVTFVNEVRFYTDIIPALEQFEEIANVPLKERLDAFIPCLGSRFSLKPNAEFADSDAILMLENIKVQNFTNVNRRIGLNTNETLATLKSIYGEMKRRLNLTAESRSALDNMYAMHVKHMKDLTIPTDTPYTTVFHNDLHINNVMVRKDNNSVKVKIYDFQFYAYDSFVFELSYFLFISVRSIDLKANFKLFVDYYISEFQKMMKLVKYPLDD
ncbi:uncharacterized protein LOC116350921 [Contarinia nasturtii]|uniref:uncharacterized protein LOC116350921 n=1 Tax=Contarinia nasturtii TaxID=265458 RepID=UPI0012D3A2B5|nr:uncharacterized protein LOC116350921 [Contarinia nasturtii]